MAWRERCATGGREASRQRGEEIENTAPLKATRPLKKRRLDQDLLIQRALARSKERVEGLAVRSVSSSSFLLPSHS